MKITRRQLRKIIKEALSDKKGLWVSYDQLSSEFGGRTEPKVEGPFTSQAVVNAVIKRIEGEQGGLARNIQVTHKPSGPLRPRREELPGHGDADKDGVMDFADTSYDSDIS